jgi:hypothetical protein
MLVLAKPKVTGKPSTNVSHTKIWKAEILEKLVCDILKRCGCIEI